MNRGFRFLFSILSEQRWVRAKSVAQPISLELDEASCPSSILVIRPTVSPLINSSCEGAQHSRQQTVAPVSFSIFIQVLKRSCSWIVLFDSLLFLLSSICIRYLLDMVTWTGVFILAAGFSVPVSVRLINAYRSCMFFPLLLSNDKFMVLEYQQLSSFSLVFICLLQILSSLSPGVGLASMANGFSRSTVPEFCEQHIVTSLWVICKSS